MIRVGRKHLDDDELTCPARREKCRLLTADWTAEDGTNYVTDTTDGLDLF